MDTIFRLITSITLLAIGIVFWYRVFTRFTLKGFSSAMLGGAVSIATSSFLIFLAAVANAPVVFLTVLVALGLNDCIALACSRFVRTSTLHDPTHL